MVISCKKGKTGFWEKMEDEEPKTSKECSFSFTVMGEIHKVVARKFLTSLAKSVNIFIIF